uniref:Putative tail protein n=1 Tax=viral metagenome TaxID=1070528 RepID=A0A6M3L3N2_9ZZZZ
MTAGVTNFPTSLDTTTNLPLAATLAAIELDGDGTDDQKHSNWAGAVGGAAVALETKVGTGASTPIANAVLSGSAAGISGWDTTPGLLGVAFPADQSVSGDANTLDDYEEGTFTPAIGDASLDGSGEGQSYGAQVGRYTKVGNRVFFHCRVAITNLGSLTTSDGARLVGLPFTSNATANSQAALCVGYGNSLAITAGYAMTGFVAANTTHVEIYLWDATTGPTVLSISELSAGGEFMMAGHYEV